MLKTPVAVAVLAALSLSASFKALAQDTSQTQQNTSQTPPDATNVKPKSLDTVVVSGSLINNAQIQTATPIYTITAQDIKARGFNSVAEVLQNSVFSTGSVQGPQGIGFTQGAQTISLYGLNPEYTLTLIDGKPITLFGQLYNGTNNFTNISNIPVGMIDHIDVLPGGGSSIYGSQAIAGVVNIVTKQNMDGADVSVRAGGYSDGGGAAQRIVADFGHQYGKLNVLGSIEFDNQSPIWYYQRDISAQSAAPSGVMRIIDYGTYQTDSGNILGYVSPPNGCGAMSSLFNGSTYETHSAVTSRYGTFCGSHDIVGYSTMQNQQRSYDGMLKLRYDLNDHVRLYSDVLVNWQQAKFTPGTNYNWIAPYTFPGGYIEDATTKHILYPDKVFAPEEVGDDYYSQLTRQDDLMYQADIGANGTFGDSGWNWDAYFMRSGDNTTLSTPLRMTAPVNGYFNSILGPVVGVDPQTGLNMYHPNYAAFFTPLTPAQYNNLIQFIPSSSNTWVNNSRVTISNDSLFQLPGGDAGVAWLAEGGSQAWYQPVQPLISTGQVLGWTASSGGGTRGHYASAFQVNLPVLKQVTLDLSGRYDHYAINNGGTNNKFTYKIGLEYRPLDSLLIRGNYATSFLAPDLPAMFLGPTGQYTTVTDYYQCATKGNNQNCGTDYPANPQAELLSNRNLQPTLATSWTGGLVWAPIEHLSLTADYLHIAITNEVMPQDADTLMRQESQCLLGQLPAGSPDCAAAAAQVIRSPLTNQVTNLVLYYVNISNEVTDSVTTEAKYQFSPTRFGTFSAQLDYNDMLKHQYQIYPGSLPVNELSNPLYNAGFKSIASGALSWSLHDTWSSTLYWHRYGSTPNYTAQNDGINTPGARNVAPWITYNWSFSYKPVKNLDLTLMVNNVLNAMPPKDSTWTTAPFYNISNYNAFGRQIMAEVDYHFGN